MSPFYALGFRGDVAEVDVRELVRQAQRHDPDAWEALYRRSYPRLVAYARRRLPSAYDADDAVSEAFARAYDQMPRLRWKGAGFDAWVQGILRNIVLERGRAAARSDGRPVPEQVSADPTPLDRVLEDEEQAAVRAAFATLDEGDRELLELRVVGQLGAEEVAAVLGKRAGAVRMAQSRALGRLRAALEEVTG